LPSEAIILLPGKTTEEEPVGIVVAACSLALIALILLDSFETVVLPRRVIHRFRFARLFYRSASLLWRFLALR
jgi:hypothetical protein